jgi:hypothetical protein
MQKRILFLFKNQNLLFIIIFFKNEQNKITLYIAV